ncbi:polysaccharide deacetylase family protein [Mesonia ostreae]|uniref:Polysaccharide deacetylase family protein n=2 Tax=Mesonia ostreae TaxID=861110 RepID=A0ABU2KI28_9FLAO|nr:polysaccharide deacetylase family protein [Mesonia ostreae]MDT0294377.1 polysaccharide deacetylase family protein [Mesonia ostreae]
MGIVNAILPIYAILIVLGAWLLVTFIASTNIKMNYFFTSWQSQENTSNQIALTFDDGPTHNTLQILEILKKHQAKASFFCIGHRVDEHPAIAKKIIEEGHTIGNHTYSHAKNLGFFSNKRMQGEIESCNRAIAAATGKTPRLYRPPFGITNPKIKKALEITEMQPVGWSVRSFDALLTSKELIYKNIIRQVKSGDVILLHDDRVQTQEVLERLLLSLKEKNYNLVTIDQLFKSHAYS